MIALTLDHYTAWHPSWVPITVVMTAGALALTLRGASPSTAVVAVALVCQLATMIAACVVVFVQQGAHLSGAPFSPSHLGRGLAGLSAGFPLALYMFVGWENGPALAEETPETGRHTLLEALRKIFRLQE